MGILDLFRKKDDGGLEFERNLALASEAGDSQKPTSPEADYAAMIGKMGFMIMDENVINFLYKNKVLHPYLFTFSPVNSTIKLSKHQSELKRIRLENQVVMTKLTMPPELYEANGMEIMDGVRLYGHDRVSEAEEGWKGHLVTEQVKVIDIKTTKEKGRFG